MSEAPPEPKNHIDPDAICGEPHPDRPEIVCSCRGSHLEHFDGATGEAWPNEAVVLADNPRSAAERIKEIARDTARGIDVGRGRVDPFGLIGGSGPSGQVDLDGRGGKVGANHPETSHQAARNVRSGSQQAQLLLVLHAEGTRGLTVYEATPSVLNKAGEPISANQCAIRMGELREKGLVVRTDSERPTTPGNSGAVYEITEAGSREVWRMRGLSMPEPHPVAEAADPPADVPLVNLDDW